MVGQEILLLPLWTHVKIKETEWRLNKAEQFKTESQYLAL